MVDNILITLSSLIIYMYIQKLVLVLNIAEILLFTVADSRGGGLWGL